MTIANPSRAYLRDLAERVFWTFIQAFGATLLASGWFDIDGITDTSILQKAGLAGLAAVLSLAKGLVAKKVGSQESAALLPGEVG